MAKSNYHAAQKAANSVIMIVLLILGIIWILPLIWIIINSLREEAGSYTPYFWPKGFTFDNYVHLFTDTQFRFPKWFLNTLIVAIVSCIGSTFMVLAVSFSLSRLRFKARKPLMNVALVLGMFPGFMSMIAIYYILKAIGLTNNPLVCLCLVYIAGSGMGYYIAKGFFDTIPKSLDEAAYLDGATKSQVFFKVTIPLSKPIIVYTILTSFMNPWVDYIFPSLICGGNYDYFTVALGMFTMLDKEYIHNYYTMFAAAAVVVSIPISILFINMQKYYVEGVTGGAVKG
ncbi:MAG: ABC transporter permease subunit [Muribaculum sp.]|nr:ABC transporter permease subunit [Muribaculum sp.]